MGRIFLLMIVFSLAGCDSREPLPQLPSQASPTSAGTAAQITVTSLGQIRLIKGPDFEGAIFPGTPTGTRMENDLYPKGATLWSPTESDILAAEAALVPFLKASNNPEAPKILAGLGTYKRQYLGVVVRGKQQIFIRFFCQFFTADELTKETIILDGGSCYFNLKFTPETKTFSDLSVNGLA